MRKRIFTVTGTILLGFVVMLMPAPVQGQDPGDLETTAGKKKHRKRQEHPAPPAQTM